MIVLLMAFLVSFLATLGVIRWHRFHGHLSADDDFSGVQKFHRHPVSRIGGVGVALGLVAVAALLWLDGRSIAREFALLLAAGIPAFAGGLAEDMTKRVGVGARLALTMGAAALGFWFLGAALTRVDVPLVDDLLRYGPVALLFTAVAVGGVANAINIIDGFNGLASGVTLLILTSLTTVAWGLGDLYLAEILVINIAGLSGFLLLNYPRGRIFLGDGGSYYLGFLIAIMSVLLIARHDQVSPLYPLVICAYPVFEVLFSIYRRKLIRRIHATAPDHIHLHSLIYRRWTRNNPKTSLWIWCGVLPFIVAGTFGYRHDGLLLCLLFLFVACYVIIYRRLARHTWKRALII